MQSRASWALPQLDAWLMEWASERLSDCRSVCCLPQCPAGWKGCAVRLLGLGDCFIGANVIHKWHFIKMKTTIMMMMMMVMMTTYPGTPQSDNVWMDVSLFSPSVSEWYNNDFKCFQWVAVLDVVVARPGEYILIWMEQWEFRRGTFSVKCKIWCFKLSHLHKRGQRLRGVAQGTEYATLTPSEGQAGDEPESCDWIIGGRYMW